MHQFDFGKDDDDENEEEEVEAQSVLPRLLRYREWLLYGRSQLGQVVQYKCIRVGHIFSGNKD